jgi:hypothetical protein
MQFRSSSITSRAIHSRGGPTAARDGCVGNGFMEQPTISSRARGGCADCLAHSAVLDGVRAAPTVVILIAGDPLFSEVTFLSEGRFQARSARRDSSLRAG